MPALLETSNFLHKILLKTRELLNHHKSAQYHNQILISQVLHQVSYHLISPLTIHL